MKELIYKIKSAIEEIEKVRGIFDIKCLVSRDPDEYHWDLLLSAPWLETDLDESLSYLSKELIVKSGISSSFQYSCLYTIDQTHRLFPILESIQKKYSLFGETNFSDVPPIVHSYDGHNKISIIPLNEPEQNIHKSELKSA